MKLSYAITVCNEFDEIIKLLTQLLNYKSDNSEIVVLLDTPKASLILNVKVSGFFNWMPMNSYLQTLL